MDIENISLIGMPGSGKSTISKILAEKINFSWVDTDLLIESWFGRSLEDVKNHLGNELFLKFEEDIVSKLSVKKCVIATGGSVVYGKKAMKRLKSLGPVVYLKCSLNEIKKRISKNPDRGLIIEHNQTIDDLFYEREPLYEKYCDFHVRTDKFSPYECVNEIIKILNR